MPRKPFKFSYFTSRLLGRPGGNAIYERVTARDGDMWSIKSERALLQFSKLRRKK